MIDRSRFRPLGLTLVLLGILARLLPHELFRGFLSRTRLLLRRFRRFHLRFDVLAFPAPRHTYSLTQIGMSVRDS